MLIHGRLSAKVGLEETASFEFAGSGVGANARAPLDVPGEGIDLRLEI